MNQDITDEDILQGLLRREKQLLQSTAEAKQIIALNDKVLKSVRDAINGFKVLKKNNDTSSSYIKLSNDISYNITTIKRPFNIPSEYSDKLTWAQKVMFVLDKHNGLFVEEICNELLKLEPEIKRLKQATTFYCSDLKKKGYLDYEQIGIKYKYSIKKL